MDKVAAVHVVESFGNAQAESLDQTKQNKTKTKQKQNKNHIAYIQKQVKQLIDTNFCASSRRFFRKRENKSPSGPSSMTKYTYIMIQPKKNSTKDLFIFAARTKEAND